MHFITYENGLTIFMELHEYKNPYMGIFLIQITDFRKGNMEVKRMLKLTLKPGEYIDIGDDIKVVFSGGSANNIHLLIDAPREVNIVRSSVKKAAGEKVDEYSRRLRKR